MTATVVTSLLRSSLVKNLMNKCDGDRSFSDRGGDALDVAAAHVADREDPGTSRFQ